MDTLVEGPFISQGPVDPGWDGAFSHSPRRHRRRSPFREGLVSLVNSAGICGDNRSLEIDTMENMHPVMYN